MIMNSMLHNRKAMLFARSVTSFNFGKNNTSGLNNDRTYYGPSWNSFWKQRGAMGSGDGDANNARYKAEYEKEMKKRFETKMNWGIKNRWEQRELDAVIKNRDVRAAQFRDLDKIKQEIYGS